MGTRLLVAAVLGPTPGASPWPQDPLTRALVLLTLAGLYLLEIRIARQRVVLANLGVSRRLVLSLAVAWGAVLELLAFWVLHALGWGG